MQQETIGKGSLNSIRSIVRNHSVKKILLITGKNSFSLSGAKRKLDELLINIDVCLFDAFEINPKLIDAEKGVRYFKQNNPDLIIAVGGGTVIDMAKLINTLAAQDEMDFFKIIQNQILINNKGVPLVAIPTTAGSGSQATNFAVVYVDQIKYSLRHEYILPDYAIIDPELTYSSPKEVAATCALDALSQAVESYWSVRSTVKSKEYASFAITLILNNILPALSKDLLSMDSISEAAHFAGKAINITTTTAAHAISYPITTYFSVPHGHAVALTLGKFFMVNSDYKKYEIQDARGEYYLRTTMNELFEMFNTKNSRECFLVWQRIMNDVGLELSFEKIGVISRREKQIISDNVNIERLVNNPVKISHDNILELISD